MTYSEKVREVLREIVKDKILKFLKRYCKCVEVEHVHGDILRMKNFLDDIQRCVIEKQEKIFEDLNLRVVTRRRFLTKSVCIVYGDREYCDEEADVFLARLRTLIEWFLNDCNLDYIIAETVENNDFNLITFINSNIDNIRRLCLGEECSLDMSMLEDFAKEGVEMAIKEFRLTR